MTIDDWRARYDGLNAEVEQLRAEAAELRKRLDVALFLVDALRARVRPEVIGEKHRDGNWWLVWSPADGQWYKAVWQNNHWDMSGRLGLFNKATHALPMPPAPEVKNDTE